jgi:hypothetical protein
VRTRPDPYAQAFVQLRVDQARSCAYKLRNSGAWPCLLPSSLPSGGRLACPIGVDVVCCWHRRAAAGQALLAGLGTHLSSGSLGPEFDAETARASRVLVERRGAVLNQPRPASTQLQRRASAGWLAAGSVAWPASWPRSPRTQVEWQAQIVLAARDAVDRQVPELLGDVVKRAEGVGREQTDVDDGRSCSMRG